MLATLLRGPPAGSRLHVWPIARSAAGILADTVFFFRRYQLDLPDYNNAEKLGNKLMTAIQDAQTFELH